MDANVGCVGLGSQILSDVLITIIYYLPARDITNFRSCCKNINHVIGAFVREDELIFREVFYGVTYTYRARGHILKLIERQILTGRCDIELLYRNAVCKFRIINGDVEHKMIEFYDPMINEDRNYIITTGIMTDKYISELRGEHKRTACMTLHEVNSGFISIYKMLGFIYFYKLPQSTIEHIIVRRNMGDNPSDGIFRSQYAPYSLIRDLIMYE